MVNDSDPEAPMLAERLDRQLETDTKAREQRHAHATVPI
jgi:hypothetical protein